MKANAAIYKRARKASLFATAATALLLTGCASTHIPLQLEADDSAEKVASVTDTWLSVEAVRKIPISAPKIYGQPELLPEGFGGQYISFQLGADAKLVDLAEILHMHDVVLTLKGDQAKEPAGIPHYSGTLMNLLNVLSKTHGLQYTHSDGVILADNGGHYSMSVPQHDELQSAITSELQMLGAEEVVASPTTGLVNFKADPNKRDRLVTHVERVLENSATIGLQVAVVNVNLDQSDGKGLDWNSLQAKFGDPRVTGTATQQVQTNQNNQGNNNNQNTLQTIASAAGHAMEVSNNGLGVLVSRGSFTLNSVLDVLSSYGKTSATQNLMLRSLSGEEVKLRSGSSIPYVSEVNVAGAFNNNSSGLLGGVQTETADSGLTVGIKPQYDGAQQVVTLGVDLELKSILDFVELSAGNQLGAITQPAFQEQEFNTVARVMVGETLVLGGLVFESISNDRTGPRKDFELLLPLDGESNESSREALFIVIRPTVTTYELL